VRAIGTWWGRQADHQISFGTIGGGLFGAVPLDRRHRPYGSSGLSGKAFGVPFTSCVVSSIHGVAKQSENKRKKCNY